MSLHSIRLPAVLPLEDGLLDWTRSQSPDMWHEIACGIDFTSPQASIDLLLTVDWIVHQPGCARATALLFLARMIQAGLHLDAPAQLSPEAARALTAQLHTNLAEGRFPDAVYLLSEPQRILIELYLGEGSVLPLSPAVRTGGTRHAQPPHAFLGWRPVEAMPASPFIRAA